MTKHEQRIDQLERVIRDAIDAFDRPIYALDITYPQFAAIASMKAALGVKDMNNIKVRSILKEATISKENGITE